MISTVGGHTLTEIEGNMNTTKYLETLGDNVWLVIAKIFPNGGYIFQDDNAPCHPISFSPPSQEFFLFKMSHLEFCSLILIVLHTFSIIFKSGD
jgi:hypothetical protein